MWGLTGYTDSYLQDDLQTWQVVTLKGHLTDRVLGYVDVQSNTDLQDASDTDRHYSQLLIRPALGYQVTKDLSIWQGYGWTPSFQPKFKNENILFQQAILEHHFSRLTVSNRSRLEENFIPGAGNTPLRFRNLTRFTYPLGKSKWSLVAYDELFINLNNAQNLATPRSGIDQNWAFMGLNRKVNDHLNIDAGYLGDYVNHRGPGAIDRWNHVLMLQANFVVN